MKTIKITILFILTLLSIQSGVGQNITIPQEVVVGFQKNRPELIIKHLNQHVELVIDGKNDIYSKQQAAGVISSFFQKNKVLQFQVLHKGNKDTSEFLIGALMTQSGKYRVYILARKTGETTNIQQIRIEQTASIQ